MIDLVTSADLAAVNSVVVRRKSQYRLFFSDENLETVDNVGIIGCIKSANEGAIWEWSRLKGIRTSVCTSRYIDTEEYVLHGDYNGKVYRQEQGNDFDGATIPAFYVTPYLDFGEVNVRKTLHKIIFFIRPEDEILLNVAIDYDWGDRDVTNPGTYVLEETLTGTTYGTGTYGTSTYATGARPVVIKNVEGSGASTRLIISSDNMNGPHSIQAIVFEFMPNGRK